MIRIFDFLLALIGLIIGFPILVIIYCLGVIDTGYPIFRQERLGKNKRKFILVKFRTMKVETVSAASHLVDGSSITGIGRFLRKTKLDELPQLWNVLKGEMSLVGPRPGLANQTELTQARDELGVFDVCPGITGEAQIRGIDMSTPELLAKVDAEMIARLTVFNYFRCILLTIVGNGLGKDMAGK